jgi:DNA modification methylase
MEKTGTDISTLGLDEQINKIIEQLNEKEIVEDEVPAVKKDPQTKLGDLWILGSHRLLCGDATKIDDVEKLMDGEKADMAYCDPPYGMFLNADFSDMVNSLDFAKDKGFKGGRKYDNVIGDHGDFNPEFINTVFASFDCKEVFLWGANYYSELLPNRNDGSWIVWDKRLEESADKMYGSCFELCWSKTKHKQDIARVKWAGVFGTEKEFDHKRHHPTQKPVGLSCWFIERYSKESDNVADLFGGSGSTLIACEQLNRKCYMMELDPQYTRVIIDRWEKLTGKKAVLQ